MAESISVSVHKHCYAWCVTATLHNNAPHNKKTQFMPPGQHVVDVPSATHIMVAKFTQKSNFRSTHTQFVLDSATYYKRDPKGILKNITQTIQKNCNAASKKSGPYLHTLAKGADKLNFSYMHRYMLNGDSPKGMKIPTLQGIPQMKTGLDEWTNKMVAHTFTRCVHAAKMVTQFKAPPQKGTSRETQNEIKRTLYAAALRAFAGPYQTKEETEDDRTLPAVFFYTNHDCDDMAMAAAAIANRLETCTEADFFVQNETEHITCSPADPYNAYKVYQSVKGPKTAYVLQGFLTQKSKQVGGHTWAAIHCHTTNSNYQGILHIEATRYTAPHQFNSIVTHFKSQVFADCKDEVCKNIEAIEMQGLAKFNPIAYGTVCAIYSHNKTLIAKENSTTLQQTYSDLSAQSNHHTKIVTLDDKLYTANEKEAIANAIAMQAAPSATEMQRGIDTPFIAKVVYNQTEPSTATQQKDAAHPGFIEAKLAKGKYPTCFVVTPGNCIAPAFVPT